MDSILTLPESEKIMILAPVAQNRKGSHTKMLDELSNQGFLRARVDGKVIYLDELDELNGKTRHTINILNTQTITTLTSANRIIK
jgi:excinuclease ABC subunit A